MGTSTNWLKAKSRVERGRSEDAAAIARRVVAEARRNPAMRLALQAFITQVPTEWKPLKHDDCIDRAYLKQLAEREQAAPWNPANWHARLRDEALDTPEARDIYFRLRQALWKWPEFAALSRGARATLEAVIELARDEAFPYLLMVPAEDVRALARLCEARFTCALRELDCLAITRPARLVRISGHGILPPWHELPLGAKAGGATGDEALDAGGFIEPEWPADTQPFAQFVVQYRRGIPNNRKRAAWWINYELLCETGAVRPNFIVEPENLARLYLSRNRRMGTSQPSEVARSKAHDRRQGKSGPLPPPGLRASLWRGLNDGSPRDTSGR